MQTIEIGNKKYIIHGETDKERKSVVGFGPLVEKVDMEVAVSKIIRQEMEAKLDDMIANNRLQRQQQQQKGAAAPCSCNHCKSDKQKVKRFDAIIANSKDYLDVA
jgi:hypothetical protein